MGNKAEITGYINFTGTSSNKIFNSIIGYYTEVINKGAFTDSLLNYGKPIMTLNHNKDIVISNENNLELIEDDLGLKFIAKTDNVEAIYCALNDRFKGCSFTFKALKQSYNLIGDEAIREVEKLKLIEVTLISDDKKPMYPLSTINVMYVPDDLMKKVNEYKNDPLRVCKEKAKALNDKYGQEELR